MMTEFYTFPAIDPVAVSFGVFSIRWYGILWAVSFLLGWLLYRRLWRESPVAAHADSVLADHLLLWIVLGAVLGGRVGWVLFYGQNLWSHNIWDVFKIWQGGMSFHGGLVGIVAALYLYARRTGLRFLWLADMMSAVVGIGLLLGRIANFINGELWGRPATVPWAVIFPHVDALPRHPSQIYEAFFEGVVLFTVLYGLALWRRGLYRPGLMTGLAALIYSVSRISIEFWREPDAQIGLIGGATMGQILTVPVFLFGLLMLGWAFLKETPYSANP